jgi:pyruvate/2-oxoglutarate dehydrogenase complex dihydrolipoamide acyltransferase (E2) component
MDTSLLGLKSVKPGNVCTNHVLVCSQGGLRQRKASRRRQAKQAQTEARRAARDQARQLAVAAEAARKERADKAALALAARGVDTSGDALWKEKQQELAAQAVTREHTARKATMQATLQTQPARAALARWLLTMHSVPLDQFAAALGVEAGDLLLAVRSPEARAAGAVVTQTADGRLMALSDSDKETLLRIVCAAEEGVSAPDLLGACTSAGIPSSAGRAEVTPLHMVQCRAQLCGRA